MTKPRRPSMRDLIILTFVTLALGYTIAACVVDRRNCAARGGVPSVVAGARIICFDPSVIR